MTTDKKLSEVLKGYDSRFLGVFLYDEIALLDPRKLVDRVLVLNYITKDESAQGRIGHFVTLDFRRNLVKGGDDWTGPYLFDPYGLPPDMPRNIMGLPNNYNVTNLFDKYKRMTGQDFRRNTRDFQSWNRWDSTCGIYSALYVQNPDYKTNPIFFGGQNRSAIDHRLMRIFSKLELLGDPFRNVKRGSVREELKFLSSIHKPSNVHHLILSL